MIGRLLVTGLAAASLAGCSASGLDAKTSFACKAPDGVTCLSVSGVYDASRRQGLPGQRPAASPPVPPAVAAAPAPRTAPPVNEAIRPAARPAPSSSGMPLRTAPRVLRIWIAPYEDSDGDLRDQSHLYVAIDRGGWQIEHTRRTVRDRFAPIRSIAPAPAAPPTAQGAEPSPHRPVGPLPVGQPFVTGGPDVVGSPSGAQ
jgi:conjugal transfer pilus assembly protein TraV